MALNKSWNLFKRNTFKDLEITWILYKTGFKIINKVFLVLKGIYIFERGNYRLTKKT
jgi:hypothetical protein